MQELVQFFFSACNHSMTGGTSNSGQVGRGRLQESLQFLLSAYSVSMAGGGSNCGQAREAVTAGSKDW